MDFVEQVKSSVDIVQVIGEQVALKKLGGSGKFIGLCPFHQEKTPSFNVHAVHQYYKCFGCGVGGDVFKFVQEREGVTFFEALRMLAERQGIPLPKRSDYSDPESKLRGGLFEMHEIAADLFRRNLFSSAGAEARAYLAKRGVPPAMVDEFQIGLSLDSWDQLTRRLQDERFPPDQLEKSGLVARRQEGNGFYDRFRARLMFPIHSESGKVIAFGGRAMKAGEEAKYINSQETEIYKKSLVLYNLHRAKGAIRKNERVVLVEGYMDVIGVYASGVQEVVASCGTALTNTQVRAFKKHSNKVTVNFDPDAAGANSTEKYIQMLIEEGMQVRVLELDGGLDPDEYVKAHGAEAYAEKLGRASGYFPWLADRARRKFDVATSEGRIAGLQFLLPHVQRVTDKLERATIAEEVASYLGVDRGLVLEQFRKLAVEKVAAPARRAESGGMPACERLLLNALLVSGEARAEVMPGVFELPLFEKLASRPILEALASLSIESGTLNFGDLEGRLNDRQRDLLANVVFADELGEEGNACETARHCLRALEAQDREYRRTALRERIKSAERSGNFQEAMRFMEELNRFEVKRNR